MAIIIYSIINDARMRIYRNCVIGITQFDCFVYHESSQIGRMDCVPARDRNGDSRHVSCSKPSLYRRVGQGRYINGRPIKNVNKENECIPFLLHNVLILLLLFTLH